MAQLTVNVPDAQLERVLNAFAATYGYRDEVPADPPPPDPNAPEPDPSVPVIPGSGGDFGTKPNPENKRAFTRRMIQQHVLGVVRSYEANRAQSEAGAAAAEKVDQEIVLS